MIQPRPIGDVFVSDRGDAFRLSQTFVLVVPGVGTFTFQPGWWFEASIPLPVCWLIWLMPLSAKVLPFACFHDWAECMDMFSQRVRDQIGMQICDMDGCNRYQRTMMYRFLRLAGPFRGHGITDADMDEARRLGAFTPE